MQISDSSSRILAGLLEARTGQQLTLSRRWRIETALSALMRERGIGTLDELITILVMGASRACRSRWSRLCSTTKPISSATARRSTCSQRNALPELAKRRAQSKRLRIWSAGCSTGQEVYSLAMMFAETRSSGAAGRSTSSARDVSSGCVDRARAGAYSQFEVQRGLGIKQMIKWFEEGADGWRAVEALRRPVRFQVHNLLEPPPHPGGFDIVLCRNVLLYLSAEKKTLAFERLASAIAAGRLADAGRRRDGDRPDQASFGADINARGLYRLTGDGSRIEKRRSPDRRARRGGLTERP